MTSVKQNKQSEQAIFEPWEDFIQFCSRSPEDYREFEKLVGYTFQNISALYEALTHKSAVTSFRKQLKKQRKKDVKLPHYERVEFLGDSVLGLVVSSMLWSQKNPQNGLLFSEGELSKIKAFLVSEKTLAEIAKKLSIHKLILLSKAEEIASGTLRKSLLADCLEAVIGAVFSDGGYQQARKLIKKLYEDLFKRNLLDLSFDYKSQLQELIQETEKKSPHYETLEAKGPDHEKKFNVAVYFAEEKLGSAWGESKKEASQKAAKEALKTLKKRSGEQK